jgi:hypothetical protein
MPALVIFPISDDEALLASRAFEEIHPAISSQHDDAHAAGRLRFPRRDSVAIDMRYL